jgi:hypothetical protein
LLCLRSLESCLTTLINTLINTRPCDRSHPANASVTLGPSSSRGLECGHAFSEHVHELLTLESNPCTISRNINGRQKKNYNLAQSTPPVYSTGTTCATHYLVLSSVLALWLLHLQRKSSIFSRYSREASDRRG